MEVVTTDGMRAAYSIVLNEVMVRIKQKKEELKLLEDVAAYNRSNDGCEVETVPVVWQ